MQAQAFSGFDNTIFRSQNSTVMKKPLLSSLLIGLVATACNAQPPTRKVETAPNTESYTASVGKYPIVDTGQDEFFNDTRSISAPDPGEAFYGQDAQFNSHQPSYSKAEEGIVLDNTTSLMWQKEYRVMTYREALEALNDFSLGGYSDWRLPTIKEAYSLILFSGVDPSGAPPGKSGMGTPFIDTRFFDFAYSANGPREIDAQMLSSTVYLGTTMGGNQTVFGVNLADGRIKGYPIASPREEKKFMVRFVRGNSDYGKNNFQDNADGTISDLATGLMWSKDDSQTGMNWKEALAWVEKMNKDNHLGHSDWRLPNAKELQSIVDYNSCPQANDKPAISELFNTSSIQTEAHSDNYPFYWTSTTHKNLRGGGSAAYVCFGDALGFFAPPGSRQKKQLMDVHGAGAQRSDPKTGNAASYPEGHGPQGDVIRINNYVRLVRDI